MKNLKSLTLSAALITFIIVSAESYETPTPTVELLYPTGFQVSIPDAPGIELFAFHGNINTPMEGNEAGEFSGDVLQQRNNRWTFKSRTGNLNPGDKLHFWTHVRVWGRGYEKYFQRFHVPGDCIRIRDETIAPRVSRAVEDTNIIIISEFC